MELRLIVIENQIMNNTQNDFISGIGNTPLIKLRAASEITGCNIYGKAEPLLKGKMVAPTQQWKFWSTDTFTKSLDRRTKKDTTVH